MLNVKSKDGQNYKLVTVLPIPKLTGLPDLLYVCLDKEGKVYKLKEDEVEVVGK